MNRQGKRPKRRTRRSQGPLGRVRKALRRTRAKVRRVWSTGRFR